MVGGREVGVKNEQLRLFVLSRITTNNISRCSLLFCHHTTATVTMRSTRVWGGRGGPLCTHLYKTGCSTLVHVQLFSSGEYANLCFYCSIMYILERNYVGNFTINMTPELKRLIIAL